MNNTTFNDEQIRMVVGSLLVLALVAIAATIRIVLVRFDTTRKVGDLLAGKLPA